MKFEYNGNLDEKARIKEVAQDIKSYYNFISDIEAYEVAALEDVISTKVNDIMRFKRLYNILVVMQNKKEIFNLVYRDLVNVYNSYLQNNLKDYLVDSIMNEIINYMSGKRQDFPLISEFY